MGTITQGKLPKRQYYPSRWIPKRHYVPKKTTQTSILSFFRLYLWPSTWGNNLSMTQESTSAPRNLHSSRQNAKGGTEGCTWNPTKSVIPQSCLCSRTVHPRLQPPPSVACVELSSSESGQFRSMEPTDENRNILYNSGVILLLQVLARGNPCELPLSWLDFRNALCLLSSKTRELPLERFHTLRLVSGHLSSSCWK
jgi:hypothetical protein